MDKASPSRPKRVKNPPVSNPLSADDQAEFSNNPNKYARRTKVGRATIGNETRVETVGLGHLKVTTTYGKRTDV
jgi:hypothetical protein